MSAYTFIHTCMHVYIYIYTYISGAYRASQSGLSHYHQIFTTENLYMLNSTFLQKHGMINNGKK